MQLTINGEPREIDAAPEMPLLWVLRDELKMTGTKFGCGVASCGACTVHVNGEATRSCQTLIGDLEGADVATIEGIDTPAAKAIQAAWVELQVPQCGYCQSGQIMSAAALLAETPTREIPHPEGGAEPKIENGALDDARRREARCRSPHRSQDSRARGA